MIINSFTVFVVVSDKTESSRHCEKCQSEDPQSGYTALFATVVNCQEQQVPKNKFCNTDDTILFAPSAKGLQKLLDISHTYGCNQDIEFNLSTD